jgi:hypothetical protein
MFQYVDPYILQEEGLGGRENSPRQMTPPNDPSKRLLGGVNLETRPSLERLNVRVQNDLGRWRAVPSERLLGLVVDDAQEITGATERLV